MGRFKRTSAPRVTATIENTVCFGDDFDDRFASPISEDFLNTSNLYSTNADSGVADSGYFEVGTADVNVRTSSDENALGASPTKSRSVSPRRRSSSIKAKSALKANANIFNTGGSNSAIVVRLPNDTIEDEDSDDDNNMEYTDTTNKRANPVHDGGDCANVDRGTKWAALDREAALRLVCSRSGLDSPSKGKTPYARPRGGNACVAENSHVRVPSATASTIIGAHKRALRTSVPETVTVASTSGAKSEDLPWVAALENKKPHDQRAGLSKFNTTETADEKASDPFGPPVLSLNDPFQPLQANMDDDGEEI